MSADSEVVRLSKIISSKTEELDAYFRTTSQPSLDIDAPPVIPLPPQQMQMQTEIFVAMDQLKALLQGPMGNLTAACSLDHINTMPALATAMECKIPTQLKVGEEMTYKELAERCQLDENDLRRVMRLLISMRVFAEPRKGFVAHNASSRLLHDQQMLFRWMEYVIKYIWSPGFTTTQAIKKWPNGQELNETAYYMLRGQTFWDSLNDRQNGELFTAAMDFLKASPQFGSYHLVRDLEWDQNNKQSCPKVMVDIGGHDGSIAAEILRRYPSVEKCIVEDLPEVIKATSVPSDLNGRLEFMEHDFFTPQPIQADTYLLRFICHDWSDKYASKIISNLIPALKPGAKIIINELCMPDPGQVPRFVESYLRGYDMCMKQFFNSKERSVDEWQAIFQACDTRFQLLRVKISPGSALAIVEFTWTG